MASSTRRVVLTGLGALTPLGVTLDAIWNSLLEGKCGIRPIRTFDVSTLPTRIGGEIDGFDAKKYIADRDGRKQIRVMARTIQLAVAAAQLAMDSAQAAKGKLDPTRFGIEFGSGLIPMEVVELGPAAKVSSPTGEVDVKTWGGEGLEQVPPLWMLKYLPNMQACHISILHDAQGPNNSITESDVAALMAMGEACRIIRRDQADFMITGGTDSKINPLSFVRQTLFRNLTKRNEKPEEASRPFGEGRDGIVLSEGGGVVALEELEHAKRRGAPIHAEMVGFGSAFDRGQTGDGMARAIRAALQQANLTPDAINHVIAHGAGHPKSDVWEAKGIHGVFGKSTPVVAYKGNLGHLGAGSPVAETIIGVLSMKHGKVPGGRFVGAIDPACPIKELRETTPIRTPYFVKLSLTDMGQCAALVCRTWE
ncbi:MAG: beta-ketoacyl-[acyl-carrier-protein] synthase family protein [Gemmataceae bacterium]